MANEFKPNVGGQVVVSEAQGWIEEYDNKVRLDKANDTKSVFYGRDALLRLLATDGSSGITFFLALKPNPDTGKEAVQLVLVPTKEDGTLLWNGAPSSKAVSTDAAARNMDAPSNTYDKGVQCPPYCP